MDEELESLQLDRIERGKSLEEIQKHSVDAAFDAKPIEKSLLLLRKGDDVQKLCVIHSLPKLYQCDSTETITKVLPRILQELPLSSCEFHIAASKAFRFFMEKKLGINLLSTVIQNIEIKDQIISNAWMETLIHIIPMLNEEQIRTSVLPLAVSKSQLNNSVHWRIGSCKILGKVSIYPSMQPYDVKTNILPLVQSLCQDVFQEVRAEMCSQLPFVAKGLGDILIKSNLLSSLVELANDDNVSVRTAAVGSVINIIPLVNKKTKVDTIVPLVKRLCERSMDRTDTTYFIISREFGALINALKGDIDTTDCVWFLKFYKTLATKTPDYFNIDATQAAQCRDNCAFNLPAITLFTVTEIPNQLECWRKIFSDLANDPCFFVRKTVAGCLHEITNILGPECKLINQDIIKLFRDDAEEVIQMLSPHLGNTLEKLCKNGILSREYTSQATIDITRAILKCYNSISMGYNWRMQCFFLEQLEYIVNCMPSDYIHQQFTPVFMNSLLEIKAKPVKCQIARILLVILRFNTKENQRQWIREHLISSLCYSKSCYIRIIYIKMCTQAMELFSANYFKKYFFEPLLSLTSDPTSNVRLCVVNLLPSVVKMIILPEDQKLKMSFDNALSKLELIERNRDVLYFLKLRSVEIKTTPHQTPDYIRNERKKYEEEMKILQGKRLTSNISLLNDVKKPTIHTSREPVRQTPITSRSVSAPSRVMPSAITKRTSPSDMRFLEQHFYIDAGITLPTENLNDLSNKNSTINDNINERIRLIGIDEISSSISSLSLNDSEHNFNHLFVEDINDLEKSLTNITDDAKVNLRNITKTKERKSKIALLKQLPSTSTKLSLAEFRINKRHSSFYSADCLDLNSTDNKKINRRSLHIIGDVSKIPISLNSTTNRINHLSNKINKEKINLDVNTSNKRDDNCLILNLSHKEKSSSLPIFKSRRPSSDVRKTSLQ